MPQSAHVHADLVGATGLEVDLEQARGGERLQRVVVGDARPTTSHDGPTRVVGRVPVDRRVDRAARRVGVALYERVVDLVDAALA